MCFTNGLGLHKAGNSREARFVTKRLAIGSEVSAIEAIPYTTAADHCEVAWPEAG